MASMKQMVGKAGYSVLPKASRGTRLQKKHRVWVCEAGKPLSAETVEKTIRHVRRERDLQNLGGSKFTKLLADSSDKKD